MASRVNPDDPRVKRTRKLIQQSFLTLLKEQDFDSITIQDIADQAELNRATFYTHFQDKYELLELQLGEMFQMITSKMTPQPDLDDPTLVRYLLLSVCEWQLETERHINSRLTLSAAIEANARKQLCTIISACLKQSKYPLPADQRKLEILATMVSCSIYGIVLQWRQERKDETAEQMVEQALPFALSLVTALK